MADNKNPWPNVQFQNINQQKPERSIAVDLARFIGYGLLILLVLRLLNLLAG